MPAPLYNRYCRYADREARKMHKKTAMRRVVKAWKHPNTRVYALSDNAAYEAGWWSTNSPAELLRGLSLQYLPQRTVWVEFPWIPMMRGSSRLPRDHEGPLMGYTREGVREVGEDSPVRVGAMLCKRDLWNTMHSTYNAVSDHENIYCHLTYLYPNGSLVFSPVVCAWALGSDKVTPEDVEPRFSEAAVGRGYIDTWQDKHPRLLKTLRSRMMLAAPVIMSLDEVQGTTRICMAALMAALSAKTPQPNAAAKGDEVRSPSPSGPKREVVEVDLFIRQKQRPGESLRASVGRMDGIKRGLHKVGAHYNYRRTEDGSDPTVCSVSKFGYHDWEAIPNTKSECCVLCGQKRWFKDAHERGDERYGVSKPKTYNVRVGATLDMLPPPDREGV